MNMDTPAVEEGEAGGLSNIAWVLALLGLVVAIADAIAGLFAGIGYRLDLWDYRSGAGALRYVFWLATGTAAVSALGVALGAMSGGRGAVAAGIAGFAIAVITAYVPWHLRETIQSLPPIHDISTDLVNPPQFVKIAELRRKDDHPVTYDGPDVAAQQRQAYPDVLPLVLQAPAEKVFETAKAVLIGMGLELVTADPALGRIEATETSLLFGFEDDVVVRIAEVADGTTRVDVRSKSRVGRSDLGTNANRIRIFSIKLLRKLG